MTASLSVCMLSRCLCYYIFHAELCNCGILVCCIFSKLQNVAVVILTSENFYVLYIFICPCGLGSIVEEAHLVSWPSVIIGD